MRNNICKYFSNITHDFFNKDMFRNFEYLVSFLKLKLETLK